MTFHLVSVTVSAEHAASFQPRLVALLAGYFGFGGSGKRFQKVSPLAVPGNQQVVPLPRQRCLLFAYEIVPAQHYNPYTPGAASSYGGVFVNPQPPGT